LKMVFTSKYWMRVQPGCSSVISGCLCTLTSEGSGVENELLEVSFVDQVLKVSSESSAVH